MHPLQRQLRPAGADRRRPLHQDQGRQDQPSLPRYTCESRAPRPLPEPCRPADDAAASPRGRQLRGDRLGHRHRPRSRPGSARFATPTVERRSSTTGGGRAGEPPGWRLQRRDAPRPRHALQRPTPWPRRRPESSGSSGRCSAGAPSPTSSTRRSPCSSARTRGSPTASSARAPSCARSRKDPERHMIVLDPRRTETAELADVFLQVKPWHRCLRARRDARTSSSTRVMVDAGLPDSERGRRRPGALRRRCEVPVADYCERAGVSEADVRRGRPA